MHGYAAFAKCEAGATTACCCGWCGFLDAADGVATPGVLR